MANLVVEFSESLLVVQLPEDFIRWRTLRICLGNGEHYPVIGWRRGVVASVVRRMNEVTVHWARLVLGWVTVFGRVYHHGV